MLDSKTTLKKYLKVFLNEFLIKKILMMTKKIFYTTDFLCHTEVFRLDMLSLFKTVGFNHIFSNLK